MLHYELCSVMSCSVLQSSTAFFLLKEWCPLLKLATALTLLTEWCLLLTPAQTPCQHYNKGLSLQSNWQGRMMWGGNLSGALRACLQSPAKKVRHLLAWGSATYKLCYL